MRHFDHSKQKHTSNDYTLEQTNTLHVNMLKSKKIKIILLANENIDF